MKKRRRMRALPTIAFFGCMILMPLDVWSRTTDLANETSSSDHTVIVTGEGRDEAVAEANACRAAVEEAIKSLLTPEVMKEKRDALEIICSKPMPYIVLHEKLESRQTNDGGPWEVKIKAVISEDLLTAEFKTKNIARREIDGEALYKALTSGTVAKGKLSKRFRESFSIPWSGDLCVTNILTQTGEPLLDPNKQSLASAFTVLDSGEKTGKVTLGFRVTVGVDMEAWEKWATGARESLAGFATKSGVFKMGAYGSSLKFLEPSPADLSKVKPVGDWYALVTPSVRGYAEGYKNWNSIRQQQLSFKQLHKEVGAEVDPEQLLVLVPKSRRLDQEWEWYQIPRDPLLAEMVLKLIGSYPPRLRVTLQDGASGALGTTDVEGAVNQGFHCVTAEAVFAMFTANRDTYGAYGAGWGVSRRNLTPDHMMAVALIPGFSKQNIVVQGHELSVNVRLPLEDVKKLRWVEALLIPSALPVSRYHRFGELTTIHAKGTYDGPNSSVLPAVPFRVKWARPAAPLRTDR